MNARPRVEPQAVVEMVERYVSKALHDAEEYINSKPLDESGIWSLHALAAEIYAQAWDDCERAIDRRNQAEMSRLRDRHRADLATQPADQGSHGSEEPVGVSTGSRGSQNATFSRTTEKS